MLRFKDFVRDFLVCSLGFGIASAMVSEGIPVLLIKFFRNPLQYRPEGATRSCRPNCRKAAMVLGEE